MAVDALDRLPRALLRPTSKSLPPRVEALTEAVQEEVTDECVVELANVEQGYAGEGAAEAAQSRCIEMHVQSKRKRRSALCSRPRFSSGSVGSQP
jgi:hypothetical protein